MITKSERQLIQRVLKKDQLAYKEFQDTYFPNVKNIIEGKIGDSRDIEEIAQNTILNAIYCLPTFSGKSSLFTWIKSIAAHEIADYYRKKKIKEVLFSIVPGLESLISQALSPETASEEVDLKNRLLGCLSSLNEGYRTLLRLKYIDQLTVAEIARKIGSVSVKSAEMKLRRARQAFIYHWQNDQSFKKINLNYNSRELSILAQHFGIAYAPVSDSEADLR